MDNNEQLLDILEELSEKIQKAIASLQVPAYRMFQSYDHQFREAAW